MKNNLWGGRFNEAPDDLFARFQASIGFDKKLARYDIAGSIAHARMLGATGIIAKAESAKIIKGLSAIGKEIEKGLFVFNDADEDIHLNIEKRLIALIGESGKRLHTARSRNDQVALDIRLYLRDMTERTTAAVVRLLDGLVTCGERFKGVVMPAFTHLQHAQPVYFAHAMLAYYEMFSRDLVRFEMVRASLGSSPLGSGACAGVAYPVDREMVARELGFDTVTRNSLDAVSDRDFVAEYLFAASLTMMHLSRLSEEMILWSSQEFAFVTLPDRYTTGSSIMPQKKNPDAFELIRGKTGRVYGHLMGLLTTMKGLPLAYNKDMQEDKEPLFDTVETVIPALLIVAEIVRSLTVNRPAVTSALQKGYLLATDAADFLVRTGVPFRTAHEIVGKAVASCERSGKLLEELTVDEWKKFYPRIDPGIAKALTFQSSVDARDNVGGTATRQVGLRLREAKKEIRRRLREIKN